MLKNRPNSRIQFEKFNIGVITKANRNEWQRSTKADPGLVTKFWSSCWDLRSIIIFNGNTTLKDN